MTRRDHPDARPQRPFERLGEPRPRLLLRARDTRDAEAVQRYCADLDVARMLARVPHPYPPGAARAFIEWARARQDAHAIWAITRVSSDDLIGVVSIERLADDATLGFWVGKEHWGRGFGSEAARAACRWGIERFGLGRILSGAFADNTASLRIHLRLGFRVTGWSKVFSTARGRGSDHIDLELDAAEWRARAERARRAGRTAERGPRRRDGRQERAS